MTGKVDGRARRALRLAALAEPAGVRGSLWRSLAVFRLASLAYAIALMIHDTGGYARPRLGWVVLAVMAAWTALTAAGQPAAEAAGARRLLAASVVVDVAVCTLAVLATRLVDSPGHIERGGPTLPSIWAAGGVLAAAITGRTLGGGAAGLLVGAATLAERGEVTGPTLGSVVLAALTGLVGGFLVRTATTAQAELAEARADRAALAERERLARTIHDGALQALALIAREAGSGLAPATVAALAGEQESALRRLVDHPAPVVSWDGLAGRPRLDLAALICELAAEAAERRPGPAPAPARDAAAPVSVAAPAAPVVMDAYRARELGAAVRAALDNVARHAGVGASAWVLVEDEGEEVVVSIRDDGTGMAPQRPAEAAGQGRLGLAQSIRGRVRDLGGSVVVTSGPGDGTEVEIRVPR